MVRIVTMKDTRPLVVRPEDVKDEPVSICRCGLSADWPYCDDSHKQARSEKEGVVYRYRRAAPGGMLERSESASVDAEGADPRPG